MSSPSTPSRALLRKIQSFNRNRVFRVAIIGQNGVGKSALTVRFLTRRFIGDYDPTLEKTYTCTRCIMGTSVDFEILDTAGQYENSKLKQQIKWCDAVVLMYSVTDRCSFNEARRLNFVITTSCRRRHKPASDPNQEFPLLTGAPVTLVANQTDREPDRMVSPQEGASMASELGCVAFTELSVREDIENVMEVFEDLFTSYRKVHKMLKTQGLAWSMASLERLALVAGGRGEKGSGGGGGGNVEEEEEEGGRRRGRYASVGGMPSPSSAAVSLGSPGGRGASVRTRRREALVS